MTRKTPIRHKVRSHKREGKPVKSFERGKGVHPRRSPRVVRQQRPKVVSQRRVPKMTSEAQRLLKAVQWNMDETTRNEVQSFQDNWMSGEHPYIDTMSNTVRELFNLSSEEIEIVPPSIHASPASKRMYETARTKWGGDAGKKLAMSIYANTQDKLKGLEPMLLYRGIYGAQADDTRRQIAEKGYADITLSSLVSFTEDQYEAERFAEEYPQEWGEPPGIVISLKTPRERIFMIPEESMEYAMHLGEMETIMLGGKIRFTPEYITDYVRHLPNLFRDEGK